MVLGFDCLVALLTYAKIRGKEAPGLFVWAVYNPCHAKTVALRYRYRTLSPLKLILSLWSSLLGHLGILQSIVGKNHFPSAAVLFLNE